MGFFDMPSHPWSPSDPPPEPPLWVGAPPKWIGAPVDAVVEIVETNEAAIFASGFVAFQMGVKFEVRSVSRKPELRPIRPSLPFLMEERPSELPAEFVRFGVLLSDGSTATNVTPMRPDSWEEPDPPVLMAIGGGGSDHTSNMRFWLWPLPPEGLLTFVVEWPQYGIPETRASIEAEVIRSAATRARAIWDES